MAQSGAPTRCSASLMRSQGSSKDGAGATCLEHARRVVKSTLFLRARQAKGARG